VPASLVLSPGEEKQFTVKLVRNGPPMPALLKVQDQPRGVIFQHSPTIFQESRIDVTVAEDAPAAEQDVWLVILSGGPDVVGSKAKIRVVVKPSDPAMAALKKPRLEAPESLVLAPGEKKQFTVKLVRSVSRSPAPLRVQGHPPGVTFRVSPPLLFQETCVEVTAAADAPESDQEVALVIFAGDPTLMGLNTKIRIIVKSSRPSL
jgi:urease beta subunit